MNAPKKKNQHFVPQFYFRLFNGRTKFISAYLIRSNKIIPRCSIADQASKSYFYGDAATEDDVCEVENKLLVNLEKAIDAGSLNKSIVKGLIEYVSYQEVRTSKKREQSKQAWQSMSAMFDLHEKAKDIEQAKDWVANNSLDTVQSDAQRWHWLQMLQSIQSTWAMEDLGCVLLRNDTSQHFVFSDAPIVVLNPHMADFYDKGVLGTMSQGLIMVSPLSSEYAVVFYDADVYRLKVRYAKILDKQHSVLNLTLDDVAALNALQFFNAESCVYSGDSSTFELFKLLTRDETSPEFKCAIDVVVNSNNQYTLKFHGALHGGSEVLALPFFDYQKAKRFTAGRAKPYKKYQKIQAMRLKRLRDKDFRAKLLAADFGGKMALLASPP